MRRTVRTFQPETEEVAAARHFAQDAATSWGIDAMEVGLVVNELACNAVLHARSRFTVTLCHDGSSTLIEVADENPRLPSPAGAMEAALSGRGLLMVERLSVAWGVRAEAPRGKVIWAQLVEPRTLGNPA